MGRREGRREGKRERKRSERGRSDILLTSDRHIHRDRYCGFACQPGHVDGCSAGINPPIGGADGYEGEGEGGDSPPAFHLPHNDVSPTDNHLPVRPHPLQ